METNFRRKISALLLAALFLGWGAALAFADGAAPFEQAGAE